MTDSTYTNGVIAVKEQKLLRDKLLRFTEMSAEEAFRALVESGYGSGAEASSVYDFEKLIAAEEQATDAFIRTYAPSDAELHYFFAPRDYHNAKALLKAEYLGTDGEKMLAPEGCIPIETIKSALQTGKGLPQDLQETIAKGRAVLQESGSGAKLGIVFEQGLYAHLAAVCKKNKTLRRLVARRADTINILVAMRAGKEKSANEMYVSGGSLKEKQLCALFEGEEKALSAFSDTPYESLVRSCLDAKAQGKPFSDGERMAESAEAEYFESERYSLEGEHPFLAYSLRRRNENANVRIVFVCLLAGMPAIEIKKRLRAY